MTQRRLRPSRQICATLAPRVKTLLSLIAMLVLSPVETRAVILFDTGDPSVNTSAPTGALANSGWQYEGFWGGNLGTPIAPHFFISAAHIGQAGTLFFYQGGSYTPVRSFSLPGSDFLIWQVRETFSSFAPLYTKPDELAKHLVVLGRGTLRGDAIFMGPDLRGWAWGPGNGSVRWGENDVADLVPYNGHDLLFATFDQPSLPGDHPNESHLSSGDSGGALFLNDGGWKLAGINYAVDDLYTAPSTATQFTAAIFDARGYYSYDGATFTLIAGDAPVPTGFYASRISSELAWICSVIAGPQVGREENFLTLTYSRLIAPVTEITYTVEESDDLVSWSAAATQDEIVATTGDLETIKAKIDIGTSTHLFARLRITRPPQSAFPSPQRKEGESRARETAAPKLHPPARFIKMVPLDD
jgi:hypothetical protein